VRLLDLPQWTVIGQRYGRPQASIARFHRSPRSPCHTSGVMNIRSATPADARSLAELIASFQPTLTVDPSGAGAEQYLASVSEVSERQYLESPRYTYFVAEHDSEIVGFIAMRDRTHLFHLFVAAEYQGQGIARSLWRHAREHALRDGGVSVFTVNSSLNAVAVYERFGFVPSGGQVKAHGIVFQPMRLALEDDA
jgi:ribosomal protein S18 acetylase RimI-like enzyme